jgi:hypothetical protein
VQAELFHLCKENHPVQLSSLLSCGKFFALARRGLGAALCVCFCLMIWSTQAEAAKKKKKSAKKPAAAAAGVAAGAAAVAKTKYEVGEDPDFAQRSGWPVQMPPTPEGAILPAKRIVAYYGNPQSKKMGALGEFPKDEMLQRLKNEVARWNKADPATPVQPALHLVAVVAQGAPGKDGKYRMVMPDKIVNMVHDWAKEIGAIMFIDIQTALTTSVTSCPASSGC